MLEKEPKYIKSQNVFKETKPHIYEPDPDQKEAGRICLDNLDKICLDNLDNMRVYADGKKENRYVFHPNEFN